MLQPTPPHPKTAAARHLSDAQQEAIQVTMLIAMLLQLPGLGLVLRSILNQIGG